MANAFICRRTPGGGGSLRWVELHHNGKFQIAESDLSDMILCVKRQQDSDLAYTLWDGNRISFNGVNIGFTYSNGIYNFTVITDFEIYYTGYTEIYPPTI